jgi:hypothetical protein
VCQVSVQNLTPNKGRWEQSSKHRGKAQTELVNENIKARGKYATNCNCYKHARRVKSVLVKPLQCLKSGLIGFIIRSGDRDLSCEGVVI